MLLHKSIIKTISLEGISGIYFLTGNVEKQTVETRMQELFIHQWQEQCRLVESNFGNCYETKNRWPSGVDTYITSEGFLATFPALYILYDNGSKCEVDSGFRALDQTLALMKKDYPAVRYYGYVGFVDLENNVHQRIIESDESIHIERYGFIADAMAQINGRIDEYIDNLLDSCYEERHSDGSWILDVADVFHLYEDKINLSIYNKIVSTIDGEIDDDVIELLEDKIACWKEDAGYVDFDDEDEDVDIAWLTRELNLNEDRK